MNAVTMLLRGRQTVSVSLAESNEVLPTLSAGPREQQVISAQK